MMETDALIARLAAEARAPARPGVAPGLGRGLDRLRARVAAAILGGGALAATLTALALGVRPDLGAALGDPVVLYKFVMAAGLAVAGGALAARLAEPGAPALSRWSVAPLALVAALGAALLVASGETLADLERGPDALACIVSIVAMAAPVVALACVALRGGAPTRPAIAGAAAGLAAGAAGAFGYALHCPNDTMHFVLVWYALGIAAATGLGALVGRRALAW